MKILVTGGTGFVGGHVINHLLSTGEHQLIVTSRSREKAKLKKWFNKIKFVEYDLREDRDDLFDYFGRPDSLIHLAWEGLPRFNELHHLENVWLNFNFIKKLVEKGLDDVNVTGTCFEYGLQEGQLSEDIETRPMTAYGLAKDSLRRFLEELQKKHKFDLKWMRLFYMFGEGQSEKSLFPQLKRALDNGDEIFDMSEGLQKRDFLPINEMVRNIVDISLQNKVKGIINNCSGEPITVLEFVESFVKKTGKNIKLNPGFYPYSEHEPKEFWGDCTKLKRIRGV